jgi:hypothetical protein
VEEINPEYMLERSFYQFQNYAAIPGLLESEYSVHTVVCVCVCQQDLINIYKLQ